jgi:threonine synthase
MDVGNPSNFARIQDLYKTKEEIQSRVVGCSISEEETTETILSTYNQYKYVSCPHTAVGIKAFQNYKSENKHSIGVCLATAHPAKFKDTVEEVLNKNIKIPKRLEKCLNKEKKTTLIGKTYDEFKKLLLNSV